MRNKIEQIFKQQQQNLPEINNQENLCQVLIQLCRDIVNFFEIDICSVLIPEDNTFIKKLLLKVASKQETVYSNIFIPPDNLPWQWKPGIQNTASKKDIILLPDMEEAHPYKDPTQFFLQCTIRAMAIVPLCLNNEDLGYMLLINEKNPRIFTNKEIDLLKESAAFFFKIIKKIVSHEKDALTAKIISEIQGYKTYLNQRGARKNPAAMVQIFLESGIQVRWILLVNKDPDLGNMWYHAVINASGVIEVNEMGTLSESGFDFFTKELVIKDRRFICVPIKTGNTRKGKLVIKYSQMEKDRAVIGQMFMVLKAIAPQLAELMYL